MKKLIALLLSIAMLCGMSVNAFAEEKFSLDIPVMTKAGGLPDEPEATELDFAESEAAGEVIDIPKGRSQQQFIDPIFVYDNDLTAADPTDMFFFSTTSSKVLALDISSVSEQYAVQLATVDWSAGQITLTGIGVLAGSAAPVLIDGVPPGEYALYVYAQDGVVAEPYTIMYNGTNPEKYTSKLALAPDLTVCTLLYGSSSIYSNGVAPPTGRLDYEEEDSWPKLGGGIEYVSHHINDGRYTNKIYGKFHSSYVNTDNAIFYQLDVGTLWMFSTNVIFNGTAFGLYDIRGKLTPRRFDALDVVPLKENPDGYGPHYLVYDCNTNQFVYFYSGYNLFLVTGGEVVSSISFDYFV